MRMTAECVKVYSLRPDFNGVVVGRQGERDAPPDLELLDKAKSHALRYGVDLAVAIRHVMADPANRSTVRSYNDAFRHGPLQPVAQQQQSRQYTDPSAEIDRKARNLMNTTGEKNYSAAVQRVLSDDRDLARRYGSWTSVGA